MKANTRIIVFLCLVGAIMVHRSAAARNSLPTHLPIVAPNLLINVALGDSEFISLTGKDPSGRNIESVVTSLPEEGTLHQITQTFSEFNIEPSVGERITQAPAIVTGSQDRVVYRAPSDGNTPSGRWGNFSYYVRTLDGNVRSEPATIFLIPDHKRVQFSDFTLDAENWQIIGNGRKQASLPLGGIKHHEKSRGLLNFYAYGADEEVFTDKVTGSDKTMWRFEAPPKFHGNFAITYNGTLQITMTSGEGLFMEKYTNAFAQLARIECAACDGSRGISLAVFANGTNTFNGLSTKYEIPLHEDYWLKDSGSPILQWHPPTTCEMIETLSGISNFTILGDFTFWLESVAIDDVGLLQGSGVPTQCNVPLF